MTVIRLVTHWKVLAIAASMLGLGGTVSAQTMYRCGNQYSQTPCGNDAQAKRLPASAAPDRGAEGDGKTLCMAVAPTRLGLADPESARFEAVEKSADTVIQHAGQPIAAKTYLMLINPKGPYGAYLGASLYACHLSQDEQRILKIEAATPTTRAPTPKPQTVKIG
jgi:hypothetical protein